MYANAINGTSFSVTLPIRLIPPNTTSAAITARMIPITRVGIPKLLCIASAIELT